VTPVTDRQDGVIYALTDPRYDNVRYVGQTIRPMKTRLREHINAARKGEKGHKGNWIRSLLELGLAPGYRILHSVARERLDVMEELTVSYYRLYGSQYLFDLIEDCPWPVQPPLTNAADGGAHGVGISGRHHTPEAKALIGAASKGNKYAQGKGRARSSPRTPEHAAKLGAARRGKPGRIFDVEARRAQSRLRGGSPIVDQLGHRYETVAEAALATGYSGGAISRVVRGERRAIGGLVFSRV
jgi:hypothetical protein